MRVRPWAEDPTGYYGERTAAAARRWQVRSVVKCVVRYRTLHCGPKWCRAFWCPHLSRRSDCSSHHRLRLLQKASGLDAAGGSDGKVDARSRETYATAHGLPAAGSGRVTVDAKANEKNTCIDVCAEFTGTQDCQTRQGRMRRDSPFQLTCQSSQLW